MKTYRVSGPFPFRGHAPGSSFEADPKETPVVRAVTRGAITEEKATAPAPKPQTSGDTGDKEKK
jgi:hypothetical protein